MSTEDFVSFILQKERTPSPHHEPTLTSPRSRATAARLSAQFPDSSDSEPGEPDNDSRLGSVQKFLPKPKPVSLKAKEPTARKAKPRKRKERVVRKLSVDLRRKSLINETIEEESTPPSSDKIQIDPKLLVNSYQNFSTDSAKELIAAMEKGAEQGRTGSQSSGSSISVSESCLAPTEPTAGPSKATDVTSLTPVDMEAATPLPAPPLDGLVVHVDFRTGADNRRRPLEKMASSLGARVEPHLNSEVTHLVFKDGSMAAYKKAKKNGVKIVAFSWLEACRASGKRVPEDEHPSVSKEKYDSPGLFPKVRKIKSMQPKTLEEDLEAAGRSLSRKQKIQSRKQNLVKVPEQSISSPAHRVLRNAVDSPLDKMRSLNLSLSLTPASAGGSARDVSPSQADLDTPLAER